MSVRTIYCKRLLTGTSFQSHQLRHQIRRYSVSSIPLVAKLPTLRASKVLFVSDFTMSQNSCFSTSATSQESWRLPPGSWDTHVHVFDPQTYPYSPKRAYSPREASFQQLVSFGKSLSAGNSTPNMVLVLPSPYGNLNESILDLLRKQEGGGKLRGIVVLEKEQMEKDNLLEMDRLGVRGVRLNMVSSGGSISGDALRKEMMETAEYIKNAGLGEKWWIQLFIPGRFWDELKHSIENLGVRIIADHLGGMKGSSTLAQGASTIEQPGFDSLIALAKGRHLIVKVSGFPRASEEEKERYPDLALVVKRLAKEVPDQLIWASDWPHTGEAKHRKGRSIEIPEPFRNIDDVAILKSLRSWVSSEVWEKMMVETPGETYA